jgi:hypothetical protein
MISHLQSFDTFFLILIPFLSPVQELVLLGAGPRAAHVGDAAPSK